MVARFMHGFEPAVAPGHHPVQYRGAIGRHPMRHARELVVRALARKLLAERLLVAGEDVDAEFPRLFDAGPTVRILGREECDQGRIERDGGERSEEHTSELQSLMSISYAVFCLKKKKQIDMH